MLKVVEINKMTLENKHFENEPDFNVSAKFANDIGELFKPPENVPPEIDRAVAEAAHRHLTPTQTRFRFIRWAWHIAAAAAVIIVTSLIFITHNPPPKVAEFYEGQGTRYEGQVVARADIDKNGRVDILDAFRLARNIESGRETEKLWDINGDGMVNHQDVDKVAFAAVSLNKGIL